MRDSRRSKRRNSAPSRTPLPHACASAVLVLAAVTAMIGAPDIAYGARVKELARVRGVRDNPLIGYGLVVGLSGTGDNRRSIFTNQSLASLLKRMGLNIPPERLDVVNTAAVMVTANLPPFASPGEHIDVVVSAIGNARSLESGTLLLTPLKGANGAVYAIAQGPIAVGGFNLGVTNLVSLRRNSSTVGRIPGGAVVERSVPATFVTDNRIVFALNEADFTTADRIAKAVNESLSSDFAAVASDPATVIVTMPEEARTATISFLARIENLEVVPDSPARVVVNERTGTVVVGGNVTLGAAAVAHGNLNVSVQTRFGVSQPGPLSGGSTVVTPDVGLTVDEGKNPMHAIPKTATVEELVKALNGLGASPRDLIAILQALKATGALRGELEVL